MSLSLTSRPVRSGTCSVAKKPGVTNRMLAVLLSRRSSSTPLMPTGQMPPPHTIGRPLMYAALVTPGSARISLEHAVVEVRAARGDDVLLDGNVGPQRQHALGAEARDPCAWTAPQRAHQQPRRDEQDDRRHRPRR